MMHSLRRVICGGEDFPAKRGKLGIVASDPLMQKEIDFINEMSFSGSCPPVGVFVEQMGQIVGAVRGSPVGETMVDDRRPAYELYDAEIAKNMM